MRHLLLFLALVFVVGSLQASDQQSSSQVTEFTHDRVAEPGMAVAAPVVPGIQEKNILSALREARRAGDVESARALQASLDALHGTGRPVSLPVVTEGENHVALGEPFGGPGPRWAGDVLLSNPAFDHAYPSMDGAPNGDLYVAVEELYEPWIRVYRSTDDGASWSHIIGFYSFEDSRHPSITYADGNEVWVHVAFEAVRVDDSRDVRVFRFDPTDPGGNYDFTTIESSIIMSGADDHIYPRICADDLIYPGYYPYVTYAVYAIDYYPVYFSRSLDYGLTWSTPANITGGAENSQWRTRPDIAYGTSGMFVAFEKLGWTGSSWDVQVWVTKSTNYGSSWDDPLQLTTSTYNQYHPSVAAAMGDDSVVVAYTRDYASDSDIQYAYSTDGGSIWDMNNGLPWTYDDEQSVDLAASNTSGLFHAAFLHNQANDIKYTYADTSSPSPFAATIVVNDTGTASAFYPTPAVGVNPTKPLDEEACVAWGDFRGTYYDAYFDCAFFGSVFELGDLNCDGLLNSFDIDPFVLALTNPAGYAAAYPGCDIMLADCNGDGVVDAFDIDPFVQLLIGP